MSNMLRSEKNRLIGVAVAVGLLGCAATHSPPTAMKAPPAAWGSTSTLTDGEVVVQVSPEIGRVMHFAVVGESTLLWHNPAPRTPQETAWPNYGGDKLWPWPQRPLWSWPPPRGFDPGPFQLRQADDGFRMVGPTDVATGLQVSRDATLNVGRLENTYSMTRTAAPATRPVPAAVACWAVTQVKAGGEIFIRLAQPSSTPQVTRFGDSKIDTVAVNKRWLRVMQPRSSGKIGVAGDALAVRSGDRVLLIERIDYDKSRLTETSAQVYFYIHDVPEESLLSYCELELVGSETNLGLGETTILRTVWRSLSNVEFSAALKM